jgi:uncharacterized protein (TIGR02246 family)
MISQPVTTDVRALLETLVAAYNGKRPVDAVNLFTEDAIFVGTGADEVHFGRSDIRAQVERDLAQAEALTVRVSDLHTVEMDSAAACYALVTLDAVVGGEPVTMPMRLTATARPDGGRLRFNQAHFSLAAADQTVGRSFTQA